MKIAIKLKTLVAIAMLSVLLSVPVALAPNYARVLVYFNIPADTSFTVAFPSAYSPESITSTDESAPTQTTSWISFNFSSPTENWIQPRTNGVAADAQSGATKPIFYIDNTGNTNEQFAINGTIPSTFAVCVNATCGSGSCGTVTSTCTALGASYTILATAVTTTSFLNVTLYGNASSSPAGQSSGAIMIRSSQA